MDIRTVASQHPDKVAVRLSAPEETLSFGQLDALSTRVAAGLHQIGLRPGDGVALLLGNEAAFLPLAWAAQRSGLYYTAISPRLTESEAAYVVGDSNASVLFCSDELADLGAAVVSGRPVRLVTTGDARRKTSLSALTSGSESADVTALEGADMLYSSGTTGRPKGVRQPLSGAVFGRGSYPLVELVQQLYGMSSDSVYLSPAPLYHSAPLRFCMAAHRIGAEVVCMRRFDAEELLSLVEKHRVTHVQVVPTMLVRLLKLPAEVRARYDVSSLQALVHAAAPCPQHVKRAVIDWLGPIVHEYYSGTEGVGFCAIDSAEWLAHPGSVGKPLAGIAHVCDDAGEEVPPYRVGTIWFESDAPFEYHGDPEKTRAARHTRGWATLGDLGHLDDEGYLYLSDRRDDLILTGGVNVYPQEVENHLLAHPKVLDAAVIGTPDEEYGERVVAFIQPVGVVADEDVLVAELLTYCRTGLAGWKCPREITVLPELPRFPDGKLRRRLLRDPALPSDPEAHAVEKASLLRSKG